MSKPGDVDSNTTAIPGARSLRAHRESKTFMQYMRDSFRTKERLDTVSRLLEVSSDEEDRALAAENLGFFGSHATPFLVRALRDDSSWRVRQHSATAIGRSGDLSAKPALTAALHDPDWHVALAAAESLDVLTILAEVSPPDVLDDEQLRSAVESESEADETAGQIVIVDFEAWRLSEELDQRGCQHLAAGDYEEALCDFTELVGLIPGQSLPYVRRGNAYEQLGQWDLAIRDYTQAISRKSLQSEALGRRAICWRKLGEWEKARSDIEKAIEIDPAEAQNWYNLGVTQSHFAEFKGALEAFNRAIGLRPEYAQAYFNRGAMNLKLGAKALALEDFTAGLTHDPTNPIAYFNRGRVHRALDDQSRAEDDFVKALELDPSLLEKLGGAPDE